jgi:rSAM/selenodomain-associated transferase 1
MKSSPQTPVRLQKSDCTLVIMAKAPRPGSVKTRLIQSLPEPAVTAFYRCLLEDTMALARSLGTVEIAIMCPASDAEELAQLAGEGVRVVAQTGEGLAAGLTSVFRHFAVNGQRIIAFNSDSPHLPASVLEDAFQALASHDLVVGPTEDGGYYLVGAKAQHPTLFEGDGMGTRSAFERLVTRARTRRLSMSLIDPFYDIDVADDLMRLATELELAPDRAPQTAAWLKEWGSAVARLRMRPEDL